MPKVGNGLNRKAVEATFATFTKRERRLTVLMRLRAPQLQPCLQLGCSYLGSGGSKVECSLIAVVKEFLHIKICSNLL